MATVYLAEDLRHGRHVAIKVLRPELAAVIGADRFVREIRTIAALQHPHILGLIDSGEVAGTAYYVMPYVAGESLRDRLRRETQLPVGVAVQIATEVAGALDYAHRQGVIHRDIKPENILLHDGAALVADFGIALAVTSAGGGTRMTETGMSLGTPHYMSPEQAMGDREITARSDVYALGAVLYELLTGEPPFTGPTAQAIVAKVVTEEPRPLAPKRHTIPPNVEAAVLTALEKLAADRFASAADFAAALRDPAYRLPGVADAAGRAGSAGSADAAGTPPDWRTRRLFVAAGAAALAGLLLGAGAVLATRRAPAAPVIRYTLAFPPGQAPAPLAQVRASPDGSRLAFSVQSGERSQLWLKARDRYDAVPLPGTDDVDNFTWSPDGQWIAFAFGTTLRKVPVHGGAAVTIADTVGGNPGVAWLDDDTIVFVRQGGFGLARVPAAGGPAPVVLADSVPLLWPTALPGEAAVLYTRCEGGCDSRQDIWLLDLESGATTRLLDDAVRAWYVPTGHLVHVRRDGAVFGTPFDLDARERTGSPVPLLDSVLVVANVFPLIDLGRSGTLVVRLGGAISDAENYEMVWVDRQGAETPLDSAWQFRFVRFGDNYGWKLSPDGRRLAIGLATDEGDDVWVKRLPNGPVSRVSYNGAAEFRPKWLSDGRLMFASNRRGSGPDSVGAGGLYIRRADGTGADSLLLRAGRGVFEGEWSPDGAWLVYRTGGAVNQVGGRDIVGMRPGIDTTPVPVVVTPYDEEAIAISPDGRWLAYESNETGRTEIFLRPFPRTDSGKWQVSEGGGYAPLWSRDGRELFYVNRARAMMAVTVGGGAEPAFGVRERLFSLSERLYMSFSEFYTPFDVAGDGRFLMARSLGGRDSLTSAPLIVAEHWLTELRERAGQ